MMLELLCSVIVYSLLSVALCVAWSWTTVMQPIRNLVARVRYINVPLLCPECCSFWVGLAFSFIVNPFFLLLPEYVSNIFCGLITHLVCVILYKNLKFI